jgi:hypothetical protein
VSRLSWIAVLGMLALIAVVAGLPWRGTDQPAPPEPTAGAGSAAETARPRVAVRPGQRPADLGPVASAPMEPPGQAPSPWSTAPLELQAPTPDQLPCGELDCLAEDPDRYRTEIHGTLAREGLERLLADLSIGGAQADEIRSQLEANLDSFAGGP